MRHSRAPGTAWAGGPGAAWMLHPDQGWSTLSKALSEMRISTAKKQMLQSLAIDGSEPRQSDH
jgi:hypothetical protein